MTQISSRNVRRKRPLLSCRGLCLCCCSIVSLPSLILWYNSNAPYYISPIGVWSHHRMLQELTPTCWASFPFTLSHGDIPAPIDGEICADGAVMDFDGEEVTNPVALYVLTRVTEEALSYCIRHIYAEMFSDVAHDTPGFLPPGALRKVDYNATIEVLLWPPKLNDAIQHLPDGACFASLSLAGKCNGEPCRLSQGLPPYSGDLDTGRLLSQITDGLDFCGGAFQEVYETSGQERMIDLIQKSYQNRDQDSMPPDTALDVRPLEDCPILFEAGFSRLEGKQLRKSSLQLSS